MKRSEEGKKEAIEYSTSGAKASSPRKKHEPPRHAPSLLITTFGRTALAATLHYSLLTCTDRPVSSLLFFSGPPLSSSPLEEVSKPDEPSCDTSIIEKSNNHCCLCWIVGLRFRSCCLLDSCFGMYLV